MPILFGTLAALILAVGAWMGYKNNDEYKKQIGLRQDQEAINIQKLAEQNAARKALKAETTAKVALIAENKELDVKLKDINAQVESVQKEIKTKKDSIRDLTAEVAKSKEIWKELGDIETIVPKIKSMRNDIAALKDDIETETANLSNLKQQKKDTEASIASNKARVELETIGQSQPYLKTTVKTVYSTWGFVTLNGGDIQGVVPNSLLDIVRDGEVVAQLRVTSVEPNRAAADILRDSLGQDIILRSGDKVIAHEVAKVAEKAKK